MKVRNRKQDVFRIEEILVLAFSLVFGVACSKSSSDVTAQMKLQFRNQATSGLNTLGMTKESPSVFGMKLIAAYLAEDMNPVRRWKVDGQSDYTVLRSFIAGFC